MAEYDFPETKERIIQELVPGRQITLAHIIANPDSALIDRIGLDREKMAGAKPDAPSGTPDHLAIGVMTITPPETAIIIADVASKEAAVNLEFVDRISGSLIITGSVSAVEASVQAVIDYSRDRLKFDICPVTKT